MFNNPVKPSKYLSEGVVYEIDIKRSTCKCRCYSGETMTGVTWLESFGGSSRHGVATTPRVNDRVIISTHCGYPLIIGSKPHVYANNVGYSNKIVETNEKIESVDTGNYSFMDSGLSSMNEAAPRDRVGGDYVVSSEGGSLLGVLRGGSVIIKASALAQVFVSKIDDLVRVVGRNLEVFTDNRVDVSNNFYNRQYRFIGYSDTHKNVREDRYKYTEIFGDTSAGEFLRGNYKDVIESEIPVVSTVVKLQYISEFNSESDNGYDDGYDEVYMKTYDLSGTTYTIVRDADGTNESYTDHSQLLFKNFVHSSNEDSVIEQTSNYIHRRINGVDSYNDIVQDANETVLDWNGISTITKNSSGIVIQFNNEDTVTLNGSSIILNRSDQSVVTLTDSSITLSSNQHQIVVSSTGIAMS